MFSFARRKVQHRVEGVLRRLVDCTTPNLTPEGHDLRDQNRHNRTIPVMVTLSESGTLQIDRSIVGLTRDISDHGISVIVPRAMNDTDVAITVWLVSRQGVDSRPVTLLGRAMHCVEIGGGFWYVGIDLSERLEEHPQLAEIAPLAEHLLPPAARKELETLSC